MSFVSRSLHAPLKFSLKPEQFSCLSASLLGESVVAVLPTAFGKSLIYQLFPQAWSFLDRKRTGQDRPCTVLVLSPLVALMRDQVHRARKMGLTSAKLVASTASAVAWADSDPTTTAVTSSVTAGHYQLLFTSPEALLDSRNEECWTSLAESVVRWWWTRLTAYLNGEKAECFQHTCTCLCTGHCLET